MTEGRAGTAGEAACVMHEREQRGPPGRREGGGGPQRRRARRSASPLPSHQQHAPAAPAPLPLGGPAAGRTDVSTCRRRSWTSSMKGVCGGVRAGKLECRRGRKSLARSSARAHNARKRACRPKERGSVESLQGPQRGVWAGVCECEVGPRGREKRECERERGKSGRPPPPGPLKKRRGRRLFPTLSHLSLAEFLFAHFSSSLR